jgi:uncharacterized protein
VSTIRTDPWNFRI